MAKATPKVAAPAETPEKLPKKKGSDEIDNLTADLIKQLNKEFGQRVAYNLSVDEAPTLVKRWIDTGSIQLNYAIRNAMGGGYPEGRIIEISGLPSSGKSHLAYHAAAVTQSLGGLVVYVDTENATPIQKLRHMGIDISKRFVYCDTHCTEEVFAIIESTVTKAKQLVDKNVPILVIWDSVAASSPKAEPELHNVLHTHYVYGAHYMSALQVHWQSTRTASPGGRWRSKRGGTLAVLVDCQRTLAVHQDAEISQRSRCTGSPPGSPDAGRVSR